MKDNRTKLLAIVLAILAIVVVIISFLTAEEKEEKSNMSILKNPSEFYTVNSCLYRTITYALKKDTDSLLMVLDKKYKTKNKITKENVLSIFPTIDGEVTFVSKKMYYEKISNNVRKYYVKGVINKNIIHDFNEIEKEEEKYLYFIVTLNSKKQLFSVEPYDGKEFMDGDENG